MTRILPQCVLGGGIQLQLSIHRILVFVRFTKLGRMYVDRIFVPAPTITTLIPVGLAVEPFEG